MHYKNGRPAKNGDKVVHLPPTGGVSTVGILYDATAGNDYCNGRIAPISHNDPWTNLRECLHADDVHAAVLNSGVKFDNAPHVEAEAEASHDA